MSIVHNYEQMTGGERAAYVYVPFEQTVTASDPTLFFGDFFAVPKDYALLVEPVKNKSINQWRARFIRLGSLATEDEYPFAD